MTGRSNGYTITEQRRRVLVLVARGLTNQEIAKELGMGLTGVKASLAGTFAALGARDRAHAVALAFTRGHLTRRDVEGSRR